MEGLVLLEPTELYNMLQQASVYSNLSDNNYLLLIDARNKDDYNESHINKDGQFFVPFDSELECRQNVVELDEIKPYPAEIITGFLYLGDWRQGNASYVQKDLKIKAHINCCVEAETFFPANSGHLLHIQCDDSSDADLSSKFEVACKFLDSCQEKNKPEAFNHVKKCSNYIQPVQAFMDQLKTWSAKVLGK
ncbi:STYL1-like protein [Mya arenaria]|uniref:STYL1-like protein n=1 Tax=Mya arenaria TaxID=6604 RepID=A0ABY7DTW7_MYAAR|nr:STYL1-like protein [Mya arenaria]